MVQRPILKISWRCTWPWELAARGGHGGCPTWGLALDADLGEGGWHPDRPKSQATLGQTHSGAASDDATSVPKRVLPCCTLEHNHCSCESNFFPAGLAVDKKETSSPSASLLFACCVARIQIAKGCAKPCWAGDRGSGRVPTNMLLPKPFTVDPGWSMVHLIKDPTYVHFHFASKVCHLLLAYVLDSLVRVSRR